MRWEFFLIFSYYELKVISLTNSHKIVSLCCVSNPLHHFHDEISKNLYQVCHFMVLAVSLKICYFPKILSVKLFCNLQNNMFINFLNFDKYFSSITIKRTRFSLAVGSHIKKNYNFENNGKTG